MSSNQEIKLDLFLEFEKLESHQIGKIGNCHQIGKIHDSIIMDKVCNPDRPTQVRFMHKFVLC